MNENGIKIKIPSSLAPVGDIQAAFVLSAVRTAQLVDYFCQKLDEFL